MSAGRHTPEYIEGVNSANTMLFVLPVPSPEKGRGERDCLPATNFIMNMTEVFLRQVVEAFKILTSDDKVKAILVNIFGGIMKCDVLASGIVNAAKQVALKVPVVTNVDQGKRILKESGMMLITAEDLDDAAEKAVKATVHWKFLLAFVSLFLRKEISCSDGFISA